MEKERWELLIGFLFICTWPMKHVCGKNRNLVHGGGLICQSIFRKIQNTGFYAYEFTHLICEIDDNNTHYAVLKRLKLGNIQHKINKKPEHALNNDKIRIPAEKLKKWQKDTKKSKGQDADPEGGERESAMSTDKERQTSEKKDKEEKFIRKKFKEGQTTVKFREDYRTLTKDNGEQRDQPKDTDKQFNQVKETDKQPDKVGYPGVRKGNEKRHSSRKGSVENIEEKQFGQQLSFIVFTVSRKINTLIRRCCIRRVEKTGVAKEGMGYIRLGSGENTIYVKRYDIMKTWDEALRLCRAEKASLVKIDTKQKMEQIQRKLCKANDKFAKFYMWIGLKDFNGTNVYKWLDGSPTEFTYWGKKDPSYTEHRSGVTVDADCVVLDNFVFDGVFWDDTYCRNVNGFICEKSLL